VIIPHTELSPEALNGVMESYALMSGTDYGEREFSLEDKVEHIKRQIDKKEVFVDYSIESNTVSLITAKQAKGYSATN